MRGDSHLYFFGVNLAAELRRCRQDPRARDRDAEAQSRDAGPADGRGIRLSGLCVRRVVRNARARPACRSRSSTRSAATSRPRWQSPDVFERLTKQGLEIETNTPDAFEAMIQHDVARYGKMLRDAGLAVN